MNDKPNYSEVDNYYISRKQPYEVYYAIKYCLQREGVTNATQELRKRLKQSLQSMRHDHAGHCIREKAYPVLRRIILAYGFNGLAQALLKRQQQYG